MKRGRDQAETEAKAVPEKKNRFENQEVVSENYSHPTGLLDIPHDLLNKDILPLLEPAGIVAIGMTSKDLAQIANAVKKMVYSGDLAAIARAIQETPKTTPFHRALRKNLRCLYPVDQNCVRRSLLYRIYLTTEYKFGCSPLSKVEELTGNMIDTLVHLEGFPQVTLLAIELKLYPKIQITPEFLKEIPLDGLSLLDFEIKIDVFQIIREGLHDQLLKLPSISKFRLDNDTFRMLSQKSVQHFLQLNEVRRQIGLQNGILPQIKVTMFLTLVTMEDYCDAQQTVDYVLNRDVAKVHYPDIVRSKLSTKVVIELTRQAVKYRTLVPFLLQAGRDYQGIKKCLSYVLLFTFLYVLRQSVAANQTTRLVRTIV